MNCPYCKQPLKVEKITYKVVVVAQEVIGLDSLGDLEHKASEVVDTSQERLGYFRCGSCFSDLRLTEYQVKEMIKNDPGYGKTLVA